MDPDIQMAMLGEQTDLLKKILETLQALTERICEDNDTMVDQNSSMNAKLADLNVEVKQLSRIVESAAGLGR